MTPATISMPAPADVYRSRRTRLASSLTRPMAIFAGEPRARHYATNTYPFRAGSNYLYFGGPPIPGAALLIEPGSNGQDGCVLVRRVLEFDEAVWIGEAPTDDALAYAAGLPISTLIEPDALKQRLGGRSVSCIAPPCPATLAWIGALGLVPATADDVQPIIEMRLIKDEHELSAMRHAASVSVAAQLAAAAAAKPGHREAEVVGSVMEVFTSNRCIPSFTPIVTVRGDVLHAEAYGGKLEAGRLLLVDAGAEEPGGYAGDVTRTYPVGGAFTPVQRQLYDTVLRAQRAAVAASTPGARFRDVHDLASRVICEGLVDAGLLRGRPSDLAARGAHTLFFTHGLGHLIGLDVHDMEDFGDQGGYARGRTRRQEFGSKFLRLDRDLEPGMTVTIEPGVYVVPAIWENHDLVSRFADAVDRGAVDKLLDQNFGGIRIEDTICVGRPGDAGPEVLTRDLPTDADAVTALLGR